MFSHSIRWRLQLWLAFLLVCVLTGFGVTVHQLQRITLRNQLDDELERRVAAVNLDVRGGPRNFQRRMMGPGGPGGPAVAGGGGGDRGIDDFPRRPPPPRGRPGGPPPDDGFAPGPDPGIPGVRLRREIRLSPETADLFADSRTEGFYFAVWSRDGSLLRRATNAPSELPTPERAGRDARLHTRVWENFREIYQFTELGECILAGRSTLPDAKAQQRLAWLLLAAGGAVLALGLGGGWWLTGRAIRPVEDISAAAMRISAGNLSERISTADPQNEFGRLAAVLNSTFARLESAFLQQKQFTADASHELRTPLAVLISEAQTTLARERSSAEYRETIEGNLAAAQQMRQLTESLLTLARLEAGQEKTRHAPFNLGELTQSCLDHVRPLAVPRQITVHAELQATGCPGDEAQIRQVIVNLLANAIHYNRDGGEVHVSTQTQDGYSVLRIRDTGPGISATDLPHIFDRFYRADKSRSRMEGHSGLGLAISKAIVDAHGGTIRAESQTGVGTTFTVSLPSPH